MPNMKPTINSFDTVRKRPPRNVDVSMPRHRVLIVEDEQDIAGLIKHTLERAGDTEASVVGSGDAALKSVSDQPPDLIILDLNLPVVSGVEDPYYNCRIRLKQADPRALRVEHRDPNHFRPGVAKAMIDIWNLFDDFLRRR